MENQKKEEKRTAILEIAKTEFAHRGYHGCSISDIARRAEVAAGTIYLYFEKKEDLLVGLFLKYLGDFLADTRPALAEVPAGEERLRRLIELQFGFFEKDPDLARVIQVYMRERNPYIRDGVRPTLLDYFGLLHDLLESGVACGAFDSSLDIRLARKVL
ncbi:MAG: TetR/AcrR family transcriptional regulator, partial [Planctomycetota bacterium]